MIPGKRTAAPALVDGIREPADATVGAVDAARGHLAAHRGRYRIADPVRDLRPVQAVETGGEETVRLQQRYRGVEVLGGQYVVRMEHKGGKRVVTGASGAYFTGLTTGTDPEVDEAPAVERAVDAVTDQLRAAGRGGAARDEAPPLSGAARGLVVLPRGTGLLTWHVTVRGENPGTGEPVLREVYVDARAGYPVLQYSGIKTFAASAAPASTSRRAYRQADDGPAVVGSGVKYDGQAVALQLTQDEARQRYVMRDQSRMGDGSKNPISTWDARDRSVSEVSGQWPAGIEEFASPTPAFGGEATEAGAVDAHWAAGKVYDYYRQVHGRDSLDGRGGVINSLVGVTDFGRPYNNAFWDGTKMVYGGGDAEYRAFSAGLDVVGHEMTHGVVENSANLVYAGQSGAMNEAIADYFGNAVKTDAYGIPMDSPDAGLLGESLCRTKPPRECATRDLNDGRSAATSFLGVSLTTDNGGVHLNSTIFSGALWDMREDIGRTLADRVVYRALTAYLTPLDGFTEGRDAVLAAARDLKASAKQLKAVERSFNAHGIVPGWELATGVDSDPLLGDVNTDGVRVGAGGGWWAASKSNENGSEPYSVWAGRADGSGAPQRISPNDGRYHVHPATDGKTVVWFAYNRRTVDLLARPIAGGPVKKLWTGRRVGPELQIEGDVVVVESRPRGARSIVEYLRLSDPTPVDVTGDRSVNSGYPSISDGRIAYATSRRSEGTWTYGTEVLDLKTGVRTRMGQLGTLKDTGPTAINGDHVFWLANEAEENRLTAVRRADLDGGNVVDLSPAGGPGAIEGIDLIATRDAVTAATWTPAPEYRNEALPKLWQFSADGKRKDRVSCNRGEQMWAGMPGGRQVVWTDSTTGHSDVVTRTRPAGSCG
ncbi:M4 family metallopeptidase [Streptomyces sp. NPDC057654]|uniref:M4 family metallopeptidase n=1 Tax=Streptomyces sp. NPDC057654 TaxID=3346196 RepID=UPI00368BDAFC